MREWRVWAKGSVLPLPMTLFGSISASMNSLWHNPSIISETLSLPSRLESLLFLDSNYVGGNKNPLFIFLLCGWLVPFSGLLIKFVLSLRLSISSVWWGPAFGCPWSPSCAEKMTLLCLTWSKYETLP